MRPLRRTMQICYHERVFIKSFDGFSNVAVLVYCLFLSAFSSEPPNSVVAYLLILRNQKIINVVLYLFRSLEYSQLSLLPLSFLGTIMLGSRGGWLVSLVIC